MEANKQINIQESAKNYAKFIQSLTIFIIQYFEPSTFKKSSILEKISSEQLTTESLFLLEKIHYHLFYSFYVYEKHFHPLDNPLHSKKSYTLLKQLQEIMNRHPFVSEEYKEHCNKIISQILTYYPQSNNKIKIILSPISPPWIANL